MIDARTGKSLSTDSPGAAEQYQLAVDRILGSETGAAEALDLALALDSNFALALAAPTCLPKPATRWTLTYSRNVHYGQPTLRCLGSARISPRSLRCLKIHTPTLQLPRPTSPPIPVTCWLSRNFVVI